MIYTNRLTLIKQVDKKYNPETKRQETVTETYGDKPYPCQISPMSRQRAQVTFGDVQNVSTVARFRFPVPDDVKYAEDNNGHKYEVVDLTNYRQDAVIYLNEVSQW